MTKRVFFSFHYDDVKSFRVNVVRNHHITKDAGEAGFFDASIWEDAELHGSPAIKRLINGSLMYTSATCVLIGSNTWSRRWVRYEIMKSYDRGNALFGVHINGIKDRFGNFYLQGNNPFDYLGFWVNNEGGIDFYQEWSGSQWIKYEDLTPSARHFSEQYRNKWYVLSNWVPIHDWAISDGYNNFSSWVNSAK